ncbi:MAG: hypothetical protein H6717_39730 [Polyangiaceae bacterium]|nr:hypothetical protein [Polyangiaceae bacterium]
MKLLGLALLCVACQPPAMTPTLEPEQPAPTRRPAAPAPPPPAPTKPPPPKQDTAPPPLSSPNPLVDGGAPVEDAAPPPPAGPPKTTEVALAQAGRAVLGCFDDQTENTGKLLVRVTVDTSGKVTHIDIVKDKSTAALLGGAFESCVRGVFERQPFPSRSTEAVIDVPLDFKP